MIAIMFDHGDIIVQAHDPLGLAAAISACVDQQFGANFHKICEAQTLGNSLNRLKGWLFECAYGRCV